MLVQWGVSSQWGRLRKSRCERIKAGSESKHFFLQIDLGILEYTEYNHPLAYAYSVISTFFSGKLELFIFTPRKQVKDWWGLGWDMLLWIYGLCPYSTLRGFKEDFRFCLQGHRKEDTDTKQLKYGEKRDITIRLKTLWKHYSNRKVGQGRT